MIFEFKDSVPQGVAAWLTMNVPTGLWEIRGVTKIDKFGGRYYIPHVFVYDGSLATMFALRWAGNEI